MKIRRISDGVIFEVRKYVNGFGEESVWCDDWYGHHLVGRDCELVDAYTAEDMEDFAEWIGNNKYYVPFYNPMSDSIVWAKGGTRDGYIITEQLREKWEQERRGK